MTVTLTTREGASVFACHGVATILASYLQGPGRVTVYPLRGGYAVAAYMDDGRAAWVAFEAERAA